MRVLDLDAWEEQTSPVARRLCALPPWGWREWCERATVAEIEAKIGDALIARHEHASLIAWQTANVMNSTGAMKHPVKAKELLDELAPYVRDPRMAASEQAGAPDDTHLANQWEAAALAGYGRVGQMTPEEVAEAQRGATAEPT